MTTSRIRPIETAYGGFQFRSRLEARWAVFFDALDLKYLYEPQGFEVDGRRYLPDFCLLLGPMLWAEVKPAYDADPDGVKRWRSFVEARGEHGVLLTDMTNGPGPFTFIGPEPLHEGQYYQEQAYWSACPTGYHFEPVPSCRFWICDRCETPEMAAYFSDEGIGHPKIAAAFDQARSHRFGR